MGTLKNIGKVVRGTATVVKGTAQAVKGTAKITTKIVKGTVGLFASSSNSSEQQSPELQATPSPSNTSISSTEASSSRPNTVDRGAQNIYREEAILQDKTATELYAILSCSNEALKKHYQPLIEKNIENLIPTGEPLFIAPHSIEQRKSWINRMMLISLVLQTVKSREDDKQLHLLIQRLFDANIDQHLYFVLSPHYRDLSLLRALLASTLVSIWMLHIKPCTNEHIRKMARVLFDARDARIITKFHAEQDVLGIMLASDFGRWITPNNSKTAIDKELLHFWHKLDLNRLLTHHLLIPVFLPPGLSANPQPFSFETQKLIVQKLVHHVILLAQKATQNQLTSAENEQLSKCLNYLRSIAWSRAELTPQFAELLEYPKLLAVLDEKQQVDVLITLLAKYECNPGDCGRKECSHEECIVPYIFERLNSDTANAKQSLPSELMRLMGLNELALKCRIAALSQAAVQRETQQEADQQFNELIRDHSASTLPITEKIGLIEYVYHEYPNLMDKVRYLSERMRTYGDNQEPDLFFHSALQLIREKQTPKKIKDETCITLVHEIVQGNLVPRAPIITGTTAKETDFQRSIFAYQFLLGNDHPDAQRFKQLYELIISGGHLEKLNEQIPLWKPGALKQVIAFYQNPDNILIPHAEFMRLFLETIKTKMELLIRDARYSHYTTEIFELAAQYNPELFKSIVLDMVTFSTQEQIQCFLQVPQGPYTNVLFYTIAQHPTLFRPLIDRALALHSSDKQQVKTLFNQPSLSGETSLMHVFLFGSPEQLSRLIDFDINIDQLDTNLDTHLHHAIKDGNTALVEQLLQKNANITIKNMQQMHALEIAMTYQPKFIKPILLRLARLPLEEQTEYLLNLSDAFYDIVLEDSMLLSTLITLSSFNLDANNPTELNLMLSTMELDMYLQKFGAQYLSMKEKSRANAKYTEAAAATKTLLIECIKAKIRLFQNDDALDIKINTFKQRYSDAIETARTVLSHYREWGKWFAYAALPVSLSLYGLGLFSFKTSSEQSLDELNQQVKRFK
ncbi:MAG: hypothetical protein P4L79_11310 [Legionella sp.]|uniref:ankyrin repeat domain-containing protein n=1 Tax=Legionella sp. TaxID=459 RepID=UPI00284960DF|nr:hypothetical protein [Legionella sp.]